MKKIVHIFLLFICCCSASLTAQTRLSGIVTDGDTKEPLIGANILVVGTGIGVATSYDGSYTLELPKDAKAIEVSYTGYDNKIIALTGKSKLDIRLSSGKVLDEVVVIGYGKVEKRDVTGAIESIKLEEQQVDQYNDVQSLIQGRAAGVYVQSSGNELLSPNSIRIRGGNSLRGDNEPLYVVDGIIITSATEDAADPLSGGSSYLSPQSGLSGINPQDIESIEILKDASATAIYGSRGANGVILITTKRGEEGKPKFSYKLIGRIGKATNLVDVLNTNDYIDYQNDFRKSQGFAPLFYTYGDGSIAEYVNDTAFMETKVDSLPRLTPVNWYDDIFETTYSQTHRLSVIGGKTNSDYFVAAGYTDSKGYIPGVRAQQGDFIFKFNQKLTERLTISPRISTTYTNNSASKGTENLGSSNTSLIRQITQGAPVLGYAENNVTENIEDVIDGPRAWVRDYDDDASEFRTLASFTADYKISEVFTYRFLAGADYRSKKRQIWFGNSIQRGKLSNGEAGISQFNRFRYNIDNTLMFNKKINRNHRINGTIGTVFDATNLEQTTFSAKDFANQDLRYNGEAKTRFWTNRKSGYSSLSNLQPIWANR